MMRMSDGYLFNFLLLLFCFVLFFLRQGFSVPLEPVLDLFYFLRSLCPLKNFKDFEAIYFISLHSVRLCLI